MLVVVSSTEMVWWWWWSAEVVVTSSMQVVGWQVVVAVGSGRCRCIIDGRGGVVVMVVSMTEVVGCW